MKSGLLVRLLVLPNGVAGVSESLAWIAETLSPSVAISLMAQYYPIHRAASNEKYRALDRSITAAEWREALDALEANGFSHGFEQELETSAKYYRPDFTDRETPSGTSATSLRELTAAASRRSADPNLTGRTVSGFRATHYDHAGVPEPVDTEGVRVRH